MFLLDEKASKHLHYRATEKWMCLCHGAKVSCPKILDSRSWPAPSTEDLDIIIVGLQSNLIKLRPKEEGCIFLHRK